jgi:rubredoxin
MKNTVTIKVNFRGGIISPGYLFDVLALAAEAGITQVSFGLRQQLLFEVEQTDYIQLSKKFEQVNIHFEADENRYPNVVSSYPAEGIFINNTWLSEGVYKDIFDSMDHRPELKINISDSNQSFTPLLTGNINWVAMQSLPHFWHLFIRFPKTNVIYEWSELVYTNDLARMSRDIERIILENPEQFIDNPDADGTALFSILDISKYIIRTASGKAVLPMFNLPYYEGLNRYHDKYWLGIYRRDERYDLTFLQALCKLCLQTRTGHFCSTPWKTIIVKGIEEKDKAQWNNLLAAYRINMRHAANELNFQVEDQCAEGLEIKNYLLKHLHKEDIRTFGICIGIKTRKKSEIFSSILVKRKSLINFFGWKLFFVYDLLCSRDFNPNARTGEVFSKNTPKALLPEQLRRAVLSFYAYQKRTIENLTPGVLPSAASSESTTDTVALQQCRHCLTVYDPELGEPEQGIPAGTRFHDLPKSFSCPLCDAPKAEFQRREMAILPWNSH